MSHCAFDQSVTDLAMQCRIAPQSDERRQLQEFISSVFRTHYGARIDTFCSQLLGVRNPDGQLTAAAGYNLAEEGPLFLEQYLDQPLEKIARQRGIALHRFETAEVGNLAAAEAGGARMLIRLMTEHLHQMGRRWVVFTATKSLINSFNRMGLPTVELARATADRVRNPAAWGSYYDHAPLVVLGDISMGYAHLEALKQITPSELLQ